MIVFGHRGAAGEAPENTLAGIKHAIAAGIKNIEVDLRLSADSQLFLLHDRSLGRTAGINKNIDALTSHELHATDARLSCKHWSDPGPCPIPTLTELLTQTPELECIQLEIKSDSSTNIVATVDALARELSNTTTASRVVVTSYDADILEALRQRASHIRLGLVAKQDLLAAFNTASALNCAFMCLHYDLILNCSEELIKTLTDCPMHISCWTVNCEEVALKLCKRNVDSIITDLPNKILPLFEPAT